jgi:hypothetical protein
MNQWLRDPFNDRDNVDMYGQPIRDFHSPTIYNPLSPTAVSDPTSEQYGHTANPNYVPTSMMGPKPPKDKRQKSPQLILNREGKIISNTHNKPQGRNSELLIVTGPRR